MESVCYYLCFQPVVMAASSPLHDVQRVHCALTFMSPLKGVALPDGCATEVPVVVEWPLSLAAPGFAGSNSPPSRRLAVENTVDSLIGHS